MFKHTVEWVGNGWEIILVRVADGTQKVFFLAGECSGKANLENHMESLTDDQRGSFFPDGKRERKEKKAKQ